MHTNDTNNHNLQTYKYFKPKSRCRDVRKWNGTEDLHELAGAQARVSQSHAHLLPAHGMKKYEWWRENYYFLVPVVISPGFQICCLWIYMQFFSCKEKNKYIHKQHIWNPMTRTRKLTSILFFFWSHGLTGLLMTSAVEADWLISVQTCFVYWLFRLNLIAAE